MKRVKQIVMMAFASLLAQCVWAATYTWEGADLASGTQKGSYTLTLNSGATYANNAISITQRESGDTSDGVSIGLNNHATPMTYIVKYSGLNPTTANNVFFCVQRKDGTKQQVYFKKGNAANTYVTFAEGDNCNNKRSFFSAPPAAGTLVIVSNSGNLAFAVTTDDTKPLSDLYYYSCDDASMGASYVNTLRIGGTTAGFNKLHRPAMTISSIQIMEEAVATKTTSTTFVPANDTDWSGKTLTIDTREVAAQGDVSFAGSPVYTQTIDSKATTAALVTSAPAGSLVYGLHALRGEEAGLGNITRDVYVSVTGGTIGAISGGEDAKYDATKSVQTGNTLINIGGNAIVDYVYGAGLGGGNSVTTTGNIGIVIDGEAQIKGSVAGGWQSRHRSNPTVTGNTTVLVKNVQTHASDATLSGNASSDRGWIIGGSMYKTNGGYGQINGNSAVVIDIPNGKTGEFAKALIGGCYMTNDGNTMTVKGSSSVTITAPDDVTFAQTIVGGGHSTGAGSNVEGNSSVTINGGKFTGNIYAGGDHNNATVAGTATITVNGGNVSGATFKPGKANGVKKLQFNTNQEFYYSNIADFGEVGVAADKTLIVKVSGSNVKDLGKFSGAGTLKKQESGTLRISGGTEGKIVVDAGTLSIKLTVDQQIAGYQTTATVNGGTLNFIDATTGSVLDNSSTTPGVFEMPKNAWMGTAGDGNWDTAGNWSYGTVPTAEQIIALTTEGTVNVTSSSVCKQLIVDANVTLAGQIAANAMPNIVIDDGKTLTINTTSDSTINGISGGTLIKDGTATLSAKVGSGTDTAPLHDMAVVIKNGKLMINQPTSPEATIHDVAFTIEETACGEDKVPLDNYGWFSVTGPWSIETAGHARVFNNDGNNTSVIKGNGAFTKLGTGKVTVLSSLGNKDNAYTGDVTVSAGELVLQPSGSGQCPNMTGTTTVNADATLTAKISSTAAANLKLTNNGTFNVDQGNVNMTKAADQSVKGAVNIAQGATLTNASNDAIAYSGSTTVNVRGTLAMGSSRWTVGGSSTINLYGGCTVTGAKTGEGSFDLYRSNEVLKVLKGNDESVTAVTIDAKIRVRNDNAKISIADGMTLAIAGGIGNNDGEGNIVSVVGGGKLAGQVNISGIELNLGQTKNQVAQLVCSSNTTTIKLEGNDSDSIASDTKTSPFITVNSGATLNLAYNNFAGWNGSVDNGYVVNNGTLKITNLADSSAFFRNHLIISDGATTELNNTYSSMIIYGGAATEDTAQIQLASGSATIASTIDNAKGINLSNDYNQGGFGTKGAGITVGTDATLTISTLFKGSESLTKYGAGKLVLSNSSNTYSGSVNLKAGTIQSATSLNVTTDVEGMMVVGDGSAAAPYSLTAVVAKIGDNSFATLQSAINSVGETATTIILAAACAETVAVPANVTIDVNSKSFTGAVTGEGTIVYTGALPEAATCTSLKNEAWTGTVVIKNYTTGNTYVKVGDYANSGSNLTLDNVKAYIYTNGTATYPNLVCNTLTIGAGGVDPVGTFSSSKTKLSFNKLCGSGNILATVNKSTGYNFFCLIGDASEFSGTIDSDYSTAAQIVFAATESQANELVEADYTARSVRVMEGATVSLGGQTSISRLTGGVFVSGSLVATGTVKPMNQGSAGPVKLCATAATITAPTIDNISSGVNHMHVVGDGSAASPYSLAMDQVTISVPSIDNTTVAVTGGTLADNAVVVDYGTAVTVTYTANENYKLVGGDGVYTFDGTADGTAGEGLSAELDTVTITIPEAPANTVVKVTVGGTEVTVENNTITATIGATVVVTYSAAEGYIMEPVSTTLTAGESTEIKVPTEAPVQAVAKIGTTLYPTLAAAFAVGGDVTLLQDTIETLTVAAGKTVTLDINGKVVKSQANTITVKGTLIVNNTAVNGAIRSVTSGKSAITTSGSGTFTINGGTIDAVGTAVSGAGTITGGTITSSGSFAVYANSSSGSIEITGGTITGATGDVGIYTGNVKVTGVTLANGIKFASNAYGLVLAGTDTALIPAEADVEVYNGETLEGYYFSASSNGLYTTTVGKVCKLVKDITHQVIIYASTTLDLNGHDITVTDKDTAILVKAGSSAGKIRTATIIGEGTVSCDNGAACNAVRVERYADLTIAGGTYVVATDKTDPVNPDNATIYIINSYKTAPTKVTITGGTFEAKGSGKYTLNILDSLMTAEAIPTITVSGGTFVKFDPAGNNDATVADGYISIAEGANYVVAQKGAAVDPTPTTDGVAITIPVGGATVEVDGAVKSTIPNTTGKHTVVIKDSTGKVIRADEVGVVNVEKTTVSTTHAVAVPFKGKTVATLLNTALLNKDDTLMAWVNGNYEVWTLGADKKWIAQTTHAQSGDHTAPAAATTVLKCGQAVWVTTAGQIVTFGDVNATGAVVELTTGHNLLGNTSLEDATPTVAATADQVQLIGEVDEAGNEIITRYNKTSTGWQSKIQKRTYIEAINKWVTTEETSNEAPTVKPGRGYWLIRK